MSGHFEKGAWVDDGEFPFINRPKDYVLGIAGADLRPGSLITIGSDGKYYNAEKT